MPNANNKNYLSQFIDVFNFQKYCREYRVGLWECPPFIFTIMGGIIILSILVTYFVARLYADPAIVVMILVSLTTVLIIFSYVLLNSFERVARASREKSEFISTMSHQLRNPLSSIKWQLDLMLQKSGQATPEETRQSMLFVQEQDERMIRLINELLEISRFENNAPIFNKTHFYLEDIIKEQVSRYSERAAFSDIGFVLDSLQENAEVFADKNKIGDVLSHFFDNAIRYSPNGGKIYISLEKIKGEARVSIVDEGIGVADDDKENMFKKFFRGTTSKKYKTEGLGTGLYVSRAIIEAQGGKVGFSSIEGKGSTFWFSLPINKTI